MPTDKQDVNSSLTGSALALPAGASYPSKDQSTAFLMRPDYNAKSAWTEHLPFAFWIIQALRPRSLVELGTHLGTSYFGFCQAVARFSTDTACYSVDTWQGDEHAGFYGNEVYDTVKAYNHANFSGFSTLVRSTFQDALPYFTDGSIDLLHIDGCHSYEAVRSDFQSWLPKLSDRGIVLMHDTNVRERDFGVFRFVEELRSDYPIFEFLHGHGLAVVGIGNDLPDEIRDFLTAAGTPEKSRDIRKIFARLGEDCRDRYALDNLSAETARLESIISKERERIKTLQGRLTALQEAHAARKERHGAALSALRDEMAGHRKKSEEVTVQNVSLNEKIDDLSKQYAAAIDELTRRHSAEIKTQKDLSSSELAALTKRLSDEVANYVSELDELRQTHAEEIFRRDAVEHSRKAEGIELRSELASLRNSSTTEIAALRKRHDDEIRKRDAELKKLREGRDAEITKRDALVQSAEGQTARLQSEIGALTHRLLELQAAHESLAESASRKSSDLTVESKRKSDEILKSQAEAQKRIRETIQNAAELIRVFAPDHPSRTSLALSPGTRALLKRAEEENIVDADWYLKHNPDVKEAGISPVRHYVLYGAAEKRLPRDISKIFK
ncbi:class I SAM-dependent methyltransferase [Paracoccus aerodenitrificans]|uniref:class I SAM-dependent methyltransferase n=1 Tax=Paracoccus aerodenitrificans TaxID=3017781 RepID=UPI0022F0B782|nr:class I SAM-dependent methyltransferase [Paracoccus aerodenitrificans]WBU63770.1 class I SAM-dependent methyltransferase [Paracoccus aerodenitrificans]